MRRFIFFGLLLIFFCFSIEAGAAEFPRRIISLAPSITEEIYMLGAEDKLVGCTVYCKRPKDAESKEKIGTIIEINLEKVVALRPDLVIATSLTSVKAIEKLKNLGIKVVIFSSPKDFTELCTQFLELAKIIGREKKAEEIISKAKNDVASIERKISGLPKPKVFVQVGARPLVTANRDSFINDFIEFSGGINVALDAKTGLYSREEVLIKNPDVIIIVTMGIAGEKEKDTWKKYSALSAVKDNRIYIMDSYKLCSPTPVSFVQALEEFVNILH